MSDPYAARLRAAELVGKVEHEILDWFHRSHPKSPLAVAHKQAKAKLKTLIDEDRKRREEGK